LQYFLAEFLYPDYSTYEIACSPNTTPGLLVATKRYEINYPKHTINAAIFPTKLYTFIRTRYRMPKATPEKHMKVGIKHQSIE
jgi:hypothetical protein